MTWASGVFACSSSSSSSLVTSMENSSSSLLTFYCGTSGFFPTITGAYSSSVMAAATGTYGMTSLAHSSTFEFSISIILLWIAAFGFGLVSFYSGFLVAFGVTFSTLTCETVDAVETLTGAADTLETSTAGGLLAVALTELVFTGALAATTDATIGLTTYLV